MSPRTRPPSVADSFTEALLRWPEIAMIARDLALPYPTVLAWKRRNYVPPEYWSGLASSARAHRVGVTLRDLRRLGEQHIEARSAATRQRRKQLEAGHG